jgi:hypothetical protein
MFLSESSNNNDLEYEFKKDPSDAFCQLYKSISRFHNSVNQKSHGTLMLRGYTVYVLELESTARLQTCD